MGALKATKFIGVLDIVRAFGRTRFSADFSQYGFEHFKKVRES